MFYDILDSIRDSLLRIGIITGVFMILLVIFMRYAGVTMAPEAYGIVSIPGYEHAVALCGECETPERVDQKDNYHMICENRVLYTINWGHLKDSQVKRLKDRAQLVCENIGDLR